jgi:CBS domain-containing protein
MDASLQFDASFQFVAANGASGGREQNLRANPPYVRHEDPAVKVMTDFARESPATIDGEQPLDDALNRLFRSSVRALLVTGEQQVTGLVTVSDLRGESIAHSGYRAWRDSLRVADVMTSIKDLPSIDWKVVLGATVGDVAEIFRGTGVECLVVIESEGNSHARIRGLIHRSRLERQTGNYAG